MTSGTQVWDRKHLISMSDVTRDEIGHILETAASMREVNRREIKKVPTLRGKTVINLFYENSTRTRTSFELAGKRMSADVINVSVSTSSVAKGETLLDTLETLQAMTPDLLVLRHPESGAHAFLSRNLDTSIINAGDGRHEHPTQSLLDILTIKDQLPLIGKRGFEGLKVAICGDLLNSRVARSNAIGLKTLGAHVRWIGPPTLIPAQAEEAFGVEVFHDMDVGLEDVDVVMILRLQRERMQGAFIPSVREYFEFWGLNRQRLAKAQPNAIVMHPGPMNRGVEIASDVADDPERSVIRHQVGNGLAVRMAVLYHFAGSSVRKG
ncbi:MAG: aspartate carbamoyltransferase catalytic subunit [Magnetococcales bacterium]|nr:aspartate carbamoyltransferase catalytic subunit [Magnetococcales bacterium]